MADDAISCRIVSAPSSRYGYGSDDGDDPVQKFYFDFYIDGQIQRDVEGCEFVDQELAFRSACGSLPSLLREIDPECYHREIEVVMLDDRRQRMRSASVTVRTTP